MRARQSALARARWLYRVPAMPAAAFLAGFFVVFQPAQVYEANAVFFGQYKLAQLLLFLVPIFAVGFGVLIAVAALGGPRWRRGVSVVYSALAVAAWTGATFFTASKGLLDGRTPLQLAGDQGLLLNGAVTFVALALGAAAAYFAPVLARRFFVVLFVLFAGHTAWIAASEDLTWRGPSDTQRLVTLSSEKNVLVLLLDGFQSDFLSEMLEAEPRIAADLEGFTFFANAVGASPTTYLAMPVIHSGTHVADGQNLAAVYEEAVVRGSFVAKLAQAGYDAMVVNAILGKCPRGATCDNSDQLVHGRLVVGLDTAAFLIDLALFRAAPHVLKPWIYREGQWWSPWRLRVDIPRTSNGLLELLADGAKPGAGRPTVRFVHLFSSHAPATLDARCGAIEGLQWTRPLAIGQARCAVAKLIGLLRSLRERGLYDQTAIFVIADHGAGLPRPGEFEIGAQASPLVMIKPLKARHSFRVDERVVGLGDLPATVCAISAACRWEKGADMLAGDAAGRVVRYPYVSYKWTTNWAAATIPFDSRFEVRGPPSRAESWHLQGEAPKGGLAALEFASSDPKWAYGIGWSEFELYEGRTLRWAVGQLSDLYLDLDPSRDARIGFEVSTHGGNAGQVVSVEVNGSRVGRFEVGYQPARHEILVPARTIRPGPDKVILRFAKAAPPGGPDPRALAVLFDRISLEQPAP
jgi:hypothetical protein